MHMRRYPSKGKLEGAGKAANAAKSGVADIVVKDADAAVEMLKKLVPMLPMNNLSLALSAEAPESDAAISASAKGCDLVKGLADKDTVVALGKDFGCAACTALVGINGITTAVVAMDKLGYLSDSEFKKFKYSLM